jgi:hypothetical protein
LRELSEANARLRELLAPPAPAEPPAKAASRTLERVVERVVERTL